MKWKRALVLIQSIGKPSGSAHSLLETIFKKYLKWSRKDHLIPFIDGLINLGRPSPNLFPKELLEQGIGLLLSGLNNTMAIQSNLDWVWPHWVERQMNPEAGDFIPTGVNLITVNLTQRNWTSIGLAHSSRESMIDPVGMLTLRPFGWSVFPFIRWNDTSYFPPRLHSVTEQCLKEETLPCIVTRYNVSPDLEWTSEAMAVLIEDEELISFRHALKNLSSMPISLVFGLAIRPYNTLMIGHINTIKFSKHLWRINRRPGLLLMDDPTQVILSDRHHGDPLLRHLGAFHLTVLSSKSGIASGVSEFHVHLNPGEERIIETAGALAKHSEHPNSKFSAVSGASLAWARAKELNSWREHAHSGMEIEIPDGELQRSFYAVKNHLHVFDDEDHFSPGTFLYHGHWFRDAAYLCLCHDRLGFSEKVRPKLLQFLNYQNAEGFFKSQSGEWDSAGQAMFIIVSHVRRTGDLDLLKTCYPALVKGVQWIEALRSQTKKSPSPHFGLLPAGFSAEHFGPNDHYFWDNFWSLAGIRATLWAARALRQGSGIQRINAVYLDFKYHLTAAILQTFEKLGRPVLPCSPYRQMDSAAVGNLVAVSPLRLIAPSEPWVRTTADYLAEHHLHNGMFFQKIIHTGLNPYLSAQLARILMDLHDARWFSILQSIRRHASPTYAWPEAIHPVTQGGCMGDGDHGWSAAEFLNLLCEMLVSEHKNSLCLAQGVPEEWFLSDKGFEVRNAVTAGGTVNFSLRPAHSRLRLEWQRTRSAAQDSLPMHFCLPLHWAASSEDRIQTNGQAKRLLLPQDEGSLFLEFTGETSAPLRSKPKKLASPTEDYD